MTDYNTYQQAARDLAVRALNSAFAWDEHPSYNTKTVVLKDLLEARTVLSIIQEAERKDYVQPIAGIDRVELDRVITLVKNRDGRSNGAIRQAVKAAIVHN